MDDNTTILAIIVAVASLITIGTCLNNSYKHEQAIIKSCNANVECINSIMKGYK